MLQGAAYKSSEKFKLDMGLFASKICNLISFKLVAVLLEV